VKGKLGAVPGKKYLKPISLDRLDRTEILRKGDNTSAGNFKFETTKFNHSVSMISCSVNKNCRSTTRMCLLLYLRITNYPLRLSHYIKRTKSLTYLNWRIIVYHSFIHSFIHIAINGACLDRMK
jgi:hypothetical protein